MFFKFFFRFIVYVSSKPSMSDMLKICCSVKNFQNISRLLIYVVLKSSCLWLVTPKLELPVNILYACFLWQLVNIYIPVSCNNRLYSFPFWNIYYVRVILFLNKYSLHALFWYHVFKTLLSLVKEAKSHLRSCGWTNEVYEFMRSRKLRAQEDGNLGNGDETRYCWSYPTLSLTILTNYHLII